VLRHHSCRLRPTRRATLFPYTTLFRSLLATGASGWSGGQPASVGEGDFSGGGQGRIGACPPAGDLDRVADLHRRVPAPSLADEQDRKSTRLNSSHRTISYAVFG